MTALFKHLAKVLTGKMSILTLLLSMLVLYYTGLWSKEKQNFNGMGLAPEVSVQRPQQLFE